VRLHRFVFVLVALGAMGCAGDAAVAPPASSDPATLYWALRLDHRAATMSTQPPYDVLKLTATPLLVTGAPIPNMPAPTFTSLDPARVQVDTDGTMHAIAPGDQIGVVASLSQGNLTHADTVMVNVTTDVPASPLTTFSIHPLPGDSAKIAFGNGSNLFPVANDADGNPIPDVSVFYLSADPTVATIDRTTGAISPVRPGKVTIIASTTVYGVLKADTLPYVIGHPLALTMTASPRSTASGQVVWTFLPDQIVAGPGAYILFINPDGPPIDVTFDDPTNVMQYDVFCGPPYDETDPYLCASGNIAAFARTPDDPTGFSYYRVRYFPVPGTYHWHSTIFGTSGTIEVADESATP